MRDGLAGPLVGRALVGRALVLAAALAALAPSAARADDVVVVLGITSLEGDDDLAHNLTGTLRHAASQVHGWRVSDAEVTLAQMVLAHGCNDEPDLPCLAQIASALSARRLVYGILRRSGSDFALTLASYDAASGEIERSVQETIAGRRTDIDDLREPARRLIRQLSGPLTGSLRIASNVPDASVRIDGAAAGTTDASGVFAMPEVPVGEHRVEVSASGYEPWSGTVTVARDTEMTLDAALVPRSGSHEDTRGGGAGDLVWPGVALLAAGAVAFGVTIYSWARIAAIQSDPDYSEYRQGWPPDMVPGDVCRPASMGVLHGPGTDATQRARASRVADLCGEAGTLEVLQYVFLGVAVAAAGAGAGLLIVGGGSGGDASEQAWQLVPSFGPDGASLRARVRF